jgi:hypothetical protein
MGTVETREMSWRSFTSMAKNVNWFGNLVPTLQGTHTQTHTHTHTHIETMGDFKKSVLKEI